MHATHPVSPDTGYRPLAKGLQHPYWSDGELFSWLLDDVLADLTGQRKPYPPPDQALAVIRDLAATYAQCVQDAPPFTDILGPLYMDTVCQNRCQERGLFFTPPAVARLMARMQLADSPGPPLDGRLYRVYEPASGSGALLLAWAATIAERDGMAALGQWSFTAIDRAPDCARMTAVQLLANASIQPCAFGELLVYQGNALGPGSDLGVVVHATAATTPAEYTPPATHPARIDALQVATRTAGLDLLGLPIATEETP